MDNEDKDKIIRDRLKEIYPSQPIASAVADLVIHKRPRGWSRKSNATYYKEIYAKQIQGDVDKMIETGNRLVYRLDRWPDVTMNTLYQRINFSARYLVEQLDTEDGKYAKWWESVRCERERGVGVVVSYIPGLEATDGFHAEIVEPKELSPEWMRKMDEWIESNDSRPFCKEGLALNPDEIHALKVRLSSLTNLQYSITSSAIKIIRLS